MLYSFFSSILYDIKYVLFTSAHSVFILLFAGQLVRKLIGDEAKLLAYDHNWDVPSYPLEVLNGTAPGTFAGTAWHCYGGDMANAMDQLHAQYPHLPQHVTECTGGYPDGVCDITKGST